ncbi:putative DNA-binding transcriptional regulator YafY [Chromohalobacter marismortui]|uniref:Putative DNA-binding transcriptional regulator YafY n=1 Tax=Chromohalobacter marismortui TaxID=42055 RepID=A0A4R7NJ21_9GAMM|nr:MULTISPECIES: WYL domain-containing protein [Chromohalobacter]MCI0511536.1 WYL domain-containing protein [Chromohalobacter sp.]MCI0594461.1 WYL domain-containing protein [Chromohalobacter sp.]TDU20477.1 putative DNA-binding transcriptional regulator YafY [Chromohalobacter marismortui]
MAHVRDTLFRYLTLLQLIPRSPGRISTPVLLEKLRERGFMVDTRSLQRDLRDKLALHFPLICDDTQKPFRWYFDRQFQSSLPALDLPSALTFVLAEEYLKGILPPVVLGQLSPQFADAHRLLDDLEGNSLSQWRKRVRAIPNGKALLPASVDASIWQCVTHALLENKAIDVCYLSRSREEHKAMVLHPQGLVSRHSVTYVVATVGEYSDLRQFALHRIHRATLSQVPWRETPAFDIDAYIADGAFGYRQSCEAIHLLANVAPQVAWLLAETPLASKQTLTPLPHSDWQRLSVELHDDQQTLWWLKGMGANVEVLEPSAWRDEIRDDARRILAQSSSATATNQAT